MLKKLVLGCTLAIATSVSHAQCTIDYFGADNVDRAMANGYFIQNYDQVCKKLQAENLGIMIFLSTGVLTGRSIATAVAILRTKEAPGLLSFSAFGTSTYADQEPSSPVVDKLATKAIMGAIDYIAIDRGIAEINEKRKAFYKK